MEAAVSSIDTVPLTRADVAWLCGMSDSWVRDRMQSGEFPRPGATAEEYVEAYVNYRLRKKPAENGDVRDLEAERARLASEQADAKAMDNAERRKELASLPDMISAMASVIEVSLARLMRVPAIVAKSNTALRQKIETAIRDALEELSATRVMELVGGGFDDEDGPTDDD